jgi:hypothetical protein
MNKSANDYLNLALLGLLGGAGTYAGARGLRHLSQTAHPVDPTPNELEIILPKGRIPKVQEESVNKYAMDETLAKWLDNSLQYAMPTAMVGGGLYAGWKGAQGLNTAVNNKLLDTEKEKIKAQYLSALDRAATKTASAHTPHVDALLQGLLDKTADDSRPQSMGDPIYWLTQGLVNPITNLFRGAGNAAAESVPMGLLGAAGLLAGTGTAGATYYLANRLDKNKEQAQHKTDIPTEIKLNVR